MLLTFCASGLCHLYGLIINSTYAHSFPLDLQVEDLVNQIGQLNLFEVVEFVECLRVKLNLQDVPMGVAIAGGDAGDAGDGEVRCGCGNPPNRASTLAHCTVFAG